MFLCASRCAKLRIKVFLFAQPRAFLCVQGAHVCVFLCASMCARLCIKVFLFAHPSVFRCVQGAHVCATRWFVVRPALFLLAHHGVFFAHRAVSFCITVFSLRAKVRCLAQCFCPSCWLVLHIGVYFSFAVEVLNFARRFCASMCYGLRIKLCLSTVVFFARDSAFLCVPVCFLLCKKVS